jgi:hypothetical protein
VHASLVVTACQWRQSRSRLTEQARVRPRDTPHATREATSARPYDHIIEWSTQLRACDQRHDLETDAAVHCTRVGPATQLADACTHARRSHVMVLTIASCHTLDCMLSFFVGQVGDECAQHRAMLETSYPVENGIVKDWTGMKHVWDYTFFEKMKVDPKEHKILLTEPPMNPISNQKQMYEHMFETYGFKAAKVNIQAMLVLYAQGLLSGVVVDSGDGVTHIVPVVRAHAAQTNAAAAWTWNNSEVWLLTLRARSCVFACLQSIAHQQRCMFLFCFLSRIFAFVHTFTTSTADLSRQSRLVGFELSGSFVPPPAHVGGKLDTCYADAGLPISSCTTPRTDDGHTDHRSGSPRWHATRQELQGTEAHVTPFRMHITNAHFTCRCKRAPHLADRSIGMHPASTHATVDPYRSQLDRTELTRSSIRRCACGKPSIATGRTVLRANAAKIGVFSSRGSTSVPERRRFDSM